MILLLNLVWLVAGGLVLGLGWYLAGVVMALSIVGLPWARACIELGGLTFAPFGKAAVTVEQARLSQAFQQRDRDMLLHHRRLSGLGLIAGVLWFPLGSVLFLAHVLVGVMACITMIGLPFGLQHFKIAGFALWPVGMRVMTVEGAEAARAESSYLRARAL